MPENITNVTQVATVLAREEKRFADFRCVCSGLPWDCIKRFSLFDRLRWMQAKRQLKALAPVVRLLSQRDKYTAEHSKRVALMTYRFCMLIPMNRFYRKIITLSAYCHDIGKLSIPEGILHKEGRLTDEEYEAIKQHPRDGAELIKEQIKYTHITDGVLYHQERWDGKGYLFGISEKQIPFPARIIAVCDSIDAMLSDRPYRKALSAEQCRAEIEKNAGVMYEPQLVQLCLEYWTYIVGDIYE